MKKEISSLHVPHNKHTAGCEPVRIALPREVVLPMNMHSGHDAVPVVAVGDHVKVGQMIAREEGRFSSPVHASVSGTVTEIGTMDTAKGGKTTTIRIESEIPMHHRGEANLADARELEAVIGLHAVGHIGIDTLQSAPDLVHVIRPQAVHKM